jgi:hypothetical protein
MSEPWVAVHYSCISQNLGQTTYYPLGDSPNSGGTSGGYGHGSYLLTVSISDHLPPGYPLCLDLIPSLPSSMLILEGSKLISEGPELISEGSELILKSSELIILLEGSKLILEGSELVLN